MNQPIKNNILYMSFLFPWNWDWRPKWTISEKIPMPTFNINPLHTQSKPKEKSVVAIFEIMYDDKERIFRCQPDEITFAALLPSSTKNTKNNIFRTIVPTSNLNQTNFPVFIEFSLVFQGEGSEKAHCFDFEIPADSDSEIKYPPIYIHEFDDDLGFFTFPTFKDELLSPPIQKIKDGVTDRFVEVNTVFYKIFYDSNTSFKQFLLVNPKLKNIDATIYPVYQSDKSSLNLNLVRIDIRAITEFIIYLKSSIFNMIKFIDLERSTIKIKIGQDTFNGDDKKIFDAKVRERYKRSSGFLPLLQTQLRLDINYLSVKKSPPKPKGYNLLDRVLNTFQSIDSEHLKLDACNPDQLKNEKPTIIQDLHKEVQTSKVKSTIVKNTEDLIEKISSELLNTMNSEQDQKVPNPTLMINDK